MISDKSGVFKGDFKVKPEMSAATVGSGGLEVLSTPSLIRLFEEKSFRAVEDKLDKSLTTVGTRILFKHLKASPIGALITYQIKYKRIGKRHYTFEFEAYEGESLIATGEHDRVVVDSAQFMQKLKQNNESQ